MTTFIPSTTDEAHVREMTFVSLKKRLRDWIRIPRDIVDLLIDNLILLQNIKLSVLVEHDEAIDVMNQQTNEFEVKAKSREIYFDYSFLIAPAYKAYEGYLYFIAEELGFSVEEYKHNIGGLYSWSDTDKQKSALIEQIKEKLSADTESIDRWRELGMILRKYRHNPSHYSGDRIQSYEEAEGYVLTIITTMDHMTRYLLDKTLLSQDKMMFYKK